MKRCLQLQREVSREFAFRVMLDEQKLYLKGVIEEKQATYVFPSRRPFSFPQLTLLFLRRIDLVLSQVGALMGTPLPPLNPPVKRTFRNVALAVVAINRMRCVFISSSSIFLSLEADECRVSAQYSRLAADYAPETALKKHFREVDYPKVRGKAFPSSSSA
jgi:hypothetical protein